MHMVFTGSPGTAKTSTARLFAQIMKDNGLLSVGSLVEVGRGDLVGKYVGWTAQIVKSKFHEAKGSVLFNDEAYALVDDRCGMFGDEAINTIVQEMENMREDIVVIFAGYTDKMEEFLQRNPGLRSRIAFHVPFADYSSEELTQILALMAKKEAITLDAGVNAKVLPILEVARREQDFGNGRFVRNLFEQARMRQATRLLAMDADKLTKAELQSLIADDFEAPPKQRGKMKSFGFCA
jgi:AAA+ superfamily predicted ATPase